MKFVYDESYQLDHYITDLFKKLEAGQFSRKHTLNLIDALISKLDESKRPYLAEIPAGMKTLSSYLVMGIDLYIRSLGKMKEYITMPRSEILKESRELAEFGSLVMNNVEMLIGETEELLHSAQRKMSSGATGEQEKKESRPEGQSADMAGPENLEKRE